MRNCHEDKAWYHGSPVELTALREGSTITQDRDLARVFSHKPTLVSISDDGKIKHNGIISGFLYCIAEKVLSSDIYSHPLSSMAAGKEWLTNRELRMTLIGRTEIVAAEQLTEPEIRSMKPRLGMTIK